MGMEIAAGFAFINVAGTTTRGAEKALVRRRSRQEKATVVNLVEASSGSAGRDHEENDKQSGGFFKWAGAALGSLRFLSPPDSDRSAEGNGRHLRPEPDEVELGETERSTPTDIPSGSVRASDHPLSGKGPENDYGNREDEDIPLDSENGKGDPFHDMGETGHEPDPETSSPGTHGEDGIRTVTSALNDVNHRSFGGLYESYVHEILTEAHKRRVKTGVSSYELATVIPYDLQKELFDEFEQLQADLIEAKEDHSGTRETEDLSAKEAQNGRKRALILEGNTKKISQPAGDPFWVSAFRFVTNPFVGSDRKENKTKEAEGSVSEHDEVSLPDSQNGTIEKPPDRETDLLLVIQRAGRVDSPETARGFVETVGVRTLVLAGRLSEGPPRAAALSALSEIALHMPSCRLDILRADGGSVLKLIMSAVGAKSRMWNLVLTKSENEKGYMIQAKISAAFLVGSLALIPGDVGKEERDHLAQNMALIAALEQLAGGINMGETEGAARAARRALAVLGVNKWVPRVPGQRGLRILSIDGGGTRALMTFETLKHLKKITGCEVHEMFDVIGGTSTGAIIAGALGVMKKPVEEVEALYRELITKIFAKNPLNSSKMLFTRAYYDTSVFEELLRRECGDRRLLDSTMEEECPKVFAVSSVLTPQRTVLTHIFRNYSYPVDSEQSRYPGSVDVPLWLSLRCSSAAPTFFTEMRVNGEVHADGAIVANNPAAVALHETRSIYPGVPVELLVSCGNGILNSAGVESIARQGSKNPKVGWTELLGSIITSATSTEQTHHALEDLMTSDRYFRFNPPTNCTDIDETDPSRLAFWVREAKTYIEDEVARFEHLAQILRPKKRIGPVTKLKDAISEEVSSATHLKPHVGGLYGKMQNILSKNPEVLRCDDS